MATTPAAGKELRVFDLGDFLLARHAAAEERVARAIEQANWRATAVRTLSWLCFAGGYVAAVLVVTQRASQGKATPGDVILAITLALPLVLLAANAGPYVSVLSQLSAAAGRLMWVADAASSATSTGGSRQMPERWNEGIRLSNVGFRYPGGSEQVLADVTLHLPPGTVLAVVGENGAGKSTLIKLLCGLYRPTEGAITFDGVDSAEYQGGEQWRSRICVGFQDFVNFEFLASESVGVGDLARRFEQLAVGAAAARGGADGVITTLPAGFSTQLGRSWTDGVELSAGHWQKVALSRGLMREEPLLVVLDEPTAALDPTAEHRLFQRVAETAYAARTTGTVTVLVSHRFSTVQFADQIVLFDAGRVSEVGTHQTLMARRGVYAELYEIQSRHYR